MDTRSPGDPLHPGCEYGVLGGGYAFGGIISIPAMFVGGVVLAYRVDAVLATVILCTVPLVCAVVVLVGRKVSLPLGAIR